MENPLRAIALISTLIAACAAGGSACLAAKDGADNKGNTLEVQVQIPPSWQPMMEDRVAEAFVDRVRDVFRRRGYEGKVNYVSSFDEPSPGCCLLTINLVEWRVGPTGNIECTFTANLQTGQANRHLGIFTDTAFRWMSGPGRFGLADSFEEAAEGAIENLYHKLEKTELVPGLRKR